MNSTRKIAAITGVIFIIATVAALVANALTPVLTGTDYLTRFSAHTNQVAAGALLYLIGYFASAGIAVVMYPVLKEWNAGLALGSVVFRTIEAAFYMVGLVCLLSLPTLGQQFTTAGAADRASLQAIGDSLVIVHDQAGAGGGVRLLPGCIYVLHPVLSITAHSPMAVGLRHRRDHPDDGGLRVGLVQREPYYQLHSPGVSHFFAGNGSGGLADR